MRRMPWRNVLNCPDRLDEDKPQPSEAYEDAREAPDDVEMMECDSCGEEKPAEGAQAIHVGSTFVDHMEVSQEHEDFCADCFADWRQALEEAEIDRHERNMGDHDPWYDHRYYEEK